MELIEILEISERDSKFQTKINVEMIWMDARIDIYNLKDDANLNTLPASERSIIWVPKLTFNNTKTNVQTVNDGKSIASVRKMGNYTKSPITFADNIFIFKVHADSLFIFVSFKTSGIFLVYCALDSSQYANHRFCKSNKDNLISIFDPALLLICKLSSYFVVTKCS